MTTHLEKSLDIDAPISAHHSHDFSLRQPPAGDGGLEQADTEEPTRTLEGTLTSATQAWALSMVQVFESFSDLFWSPVKALTFNLGQPIFERERT